MGASVIHSQIVQDPAKVGPDVKNSAKAGHTVKQAKRALESVLGMSERA
jgi:hypothetical protein